MKKIAFVIVCIWLITAFSFMMLGYFIGESTAKCPTITKEQCYEACEDKIVETLNSSEFHGIYCGGIFEGVTIVR